MQSSEEKLLKKKNQLKSCELQEVNRVQMELLPSAAMMHSLHARALGSDVEMMPHPHIDSHNKEPRLKGGTDASLTARVSHSSANTNIEI